MGPNWRTSFVCCVVCHLFLYAARIYIYDLRMFLFLVFTFNWLLADVRSCTKQTE